MNHGNFFPTEDYKLPDNSNYMKLKDGENNFRVLSSAVVGYEYWNNENKPVRSHDRFEQLPEDIRYEHGKPTAIKHFWAFVVWNYVAGKVQILELTQKTIMGSMQALIKNSKWGHPEGYDITVTRIGSGLDTEYQVVPNPHSDIPEEAVEAITGRNIDLERLFDGGDPFAN